MELLNMNKIRGGGAFIAAVLCVATAPSPSWAAECSYTAGDVSLAGGKVAFAYDENDKITELRMTPDEGEILTLTGDALNFAAGSKIIPALRGVSRIANKISTATGKITIASGVTNMTWSGSNLSGTEVTVFSNVNLADISPVSATASSSNIGNNTLTPCWVERTGDKMTVEFQVLDGEGPGTAKAHTKCVYVQLRQDGANVVAKKLNNGFFPAYEDGVPAHWGSWYFGFRMFGNPARSPSNATYHVNKMVFGPRRDTYDYRGNLLSGEFETVVAANANVEELEIVYGATGHEQRHADALSANIGRARVEPHHAAYDSKTGILSAQMVNTYTEGVVKCVKVELKQRGSDVVARVAYAKYAETDDADFDFDKGGTEVTVATEANFANAASEAMYGIDMLSLRRSTAYDTRLTLLAGAQNIFDADFLGTNAVVTFEAADASSVITIAHSQGGLTRCAYILRGFPDRKLTFNLDNANALPSDAFDAWGNVQVNVNAKPGGDYHPAISLHSGSSLYTGSRVPFSSSQQVVVEGGDLYLQNASHIFPNTRTKSIELSGGTLHYESTGSNFTYLNYITFGNGSSLTGDGDTLRVGWTGNPAKWRVTGTGASTCDTDVEMFGSNDNYREFVIDVADTVAGAGADFVMNGRMWHSRNGNHAQSAVVKTGAGTVQMNGQLAITNRPNRIVEGTFLLGVNGVTLGGAGVAANGDTDFSLEGGALACAAGTTNAAGTLAVKGDCTLSIGKGATVSFADLTVEDGKTLAVEYVDGIDGRAVRVSTALDAATLSRITLNGKCARQSSGGYLRTCDGFMFIVR